MSKRPSFTLTPPKSLNSGDVAGFLGGLVGYALFISYIRYGAGGPTGWLKAKFLNKPLQAAALTPAPTTPTPPPTPNLTEPEPINPFPDRGPTGLNGFSGGVV